MILFFYGEDNYRLRQKVNQLKKKFVDASLGDTNLAVLDGKTIVFNELVRQVLAFPFLANSRLVIVENLLKEGKKEVQEKVLDLLAKVPETTVLVFVEEGKPDKRTSLFKKLNLPKQAQEVAVLAPNQLNNWIKDEVEGRGGQISLGSAIKLVEYVGNDLWRLSNEIDKLLTFVVNRDQKITDEDIALLVRSRTESDVFALVDAIAAKKRKQAFLELYNLLENGAHELYILTMIVYQYRNLLMVSDELNRGVRTHWDLAKKLKLHPFVAQKTLALAKNYDFQALKQIYAQLADFDLQIKTGKINGKTALDLLIAKLCA